MFLVPKENVWGHFWFIPLIFMLSVMAVFFIKILCKSKKCFNVILLASIIMIFLPSTTKWFGLNEIKNYIFYYLFGMLLAKSLEFIEKVLISKWSIIFFPIAIALFIIDRTLIDNILIKAIVMVVIAIIMILFTLWFSNYFKSKYHCLNKISNYTYSIFILSWPSQAVVEIVANKILGLNVYVIMILMFLAGLFVPISIIKTVELIESNTTIKILSPIIGR